ncbi:GIY-YIG nuclease family protein [Leucobacter sp. CSA2]|uniref:GIY-YIG nuclease family protein n=1 Tax=Leucobacter edaphi TaxID=2796472 RepID=A0A934UY81_9MICO|nr:GIY-YIG nuclease family protein [Leucobacter edaphi]MBK0421802.1 GIY-YIG nuclease family protein [Leucobacter edaphi]
MSTQVAPSMSTPAQEGHFVYLYRSPGGKIRYVGYGESPSRALSHQDSSHNDRLKRFIESKDYSLEIAGPYGSREEGLHVETALISALHPEFNDAPGDQTRFRPLGVPGNLADRVPLEPLSESELGRIGRGALVVYLAAGDFMKDGRKKANPASPDVEIIARDCEKWWQVQRHMESWLSGESPVPQTLVAVFGPRPASRFIIGAFEIDRERFGRDPDRDRDGSNWVIPLLDRTNADAQGLRGRRLKPIRFGQGKHRIYHWIDGDGTVRWNGN